MPKKSKIEKYQELHRRVLITWAVLIIGAFETLARRIAAEIVQDYEKYILPRSYFVNGEIGYVQWTFCGLEDNQYKIQIRIRLKELVELDSPIKYRWILCEFRGQTDARVLELTNVEFLYLSGRNAEEVLNKIRNDFERPLEDIHKLGWKWAYETVEKLVSLCRQGTIKYERKGERSYRYAKKLEAYAKQQMSEMLMENTDLKVAEIGL